MPFSQVSIEGLLLEQVGPEIFVTWKGTLGSGWYQIYVDRKLAWAGKSRFASLPIPVVNDKRSVSLQVGVVEANERFQDFSAILADQAGQTNRVMISWQGGSYLDRSGHDDIAGFKIFMSRSANTGIDLTVPVATIGAYPGGWISDGYGLSGFGQGGYGRAATSYQWLSPTLSSGTWQFSIVTFDKAGNQQQSIVTQSITIAAPPSAPALNSFGLRLDYSYSGAQDRSALLFWQTT